MILREELLKKVKLIEITTKKVVNDVLTGRYKSHFKGQGVQFSEHRQYVPGDDVRHIDWKVSARTREPLIKKFEEERELAVLLLVDTSASGVFGSRTVPKLEIVTESAAILAHAASQTGDKVGAVFFSGTVDRVFPSRKGRAHVQRIVRELLQVEPGMGGTDLASALEVAGRVLKHSGIVFILSDFLSPHFEMPLRRLARKHDVIALRIADPRESALPQEGYLWVVDPETGVERLIDTESGRFRSWFEQWSREREKSLKELFRKTGIDEVRMGTDGSHADVIVKYFQARMKKSTPVATAVGSKLDPISGSISESSSETSKPLKPSVFEKLRSKVPWLIFFALFSGAPFFLAQAKEATRGAEEPTRASEELQVPPNWESLPLVDIDFSEKPESPLRVGDVISAQLSGFEFQKDWRVVYPFRKTTEVSRFLLVDPLLKVESTSASVAHFQIGLVSPGDIQIPSLGVVNHEGKWVARTSPWLIPLVLHVLGQEEQQPEAQPSSVPPRPPRALRLPLFWTLLLAATLLFALGFLSWQLYRYWEKRRSRVKVEIAATPSVLPEDEEGLLALKKFRDVDWLEVRSKRELYFAISDVLKRYSGRRWRFDALESTSDEFLATLQVCEGVTKAQYTQISDLFSRLDRVKFANQTPADGEPLALLDEAERYIVKTRRSPAVQSSETSGGL